MESNLSKLSTKQLEEELAIIKQLLKKAKEAKLPILCEQKKQEIKETIVKKEVIPEKSGEKLVAEKSINKATTKEAKEKTTEKKIMPEKPENKATIKGTKEIQKIESIPLSSDKLEELIANILSDQSIIKKIEKLKIRGFDNEFDIDVNVGIKKFFQNIDIDLTGKIKNTETSIAVVGYIIKANKFEEKVKKTMEDNLGTLDIKIKEYLEKKYKQDIEKIQIENGKLHIYFKA